MLCLIGLFWPRARRQEQSWARSLGTQLGISCSAVERLAQVRGSESDADVGPRCQREGDSCALEGIRAVDELDSLSHHPLSIVTNIDCNIENGYKFKDKKYIRENNLSIY